MSRTNPSRSYLETLFSLDGKRAVLTGAAGGIGSAIADALLSAGARVMLVDYRPEPLEGAVARLSAHGERVESRVCDLTNPQEIAGLAAHVASRFGTVQVLVHSAGFSKQQPLTEYADEDWRRTFQVNVDAAFLLARHLVPLMRDTGGSIIHITSINAEMGFPDNPAYVASKGALRQLTRSLAVDLGKHNIRVNSIGPSYFTTDMTTRSWNNPDRRAYIAAKAPLNRWGNPADLAGAVILLASDASSFISGQDLYVDGGWLAKGL